MTHFSQISAQISAIDKANIDYQKALNDRNFADELYRHRPDLCDVQKLQNVVAEKLNILDRESRKLIEIINLKP